MAFRSLPSLFVFCSCFGVLFQTYDMLPRAKARSRRNANTQRATHAPALTLNERCLLENGQCLLEASNLGLSALLPALVGFGLGHAAPVELPEILENGGVLGACGLAVRSQLCDFLVSRSSFCRFVLDVLVFRGPRDFVLLRHLLESFLCGRLCSLFLSQVGGEIGLDYFEDADDASARISRLGVQLWPGGLLHEGAKLASVLKYQLTKALPNRDNGQ